jgi:quinoprotein glucose dehydrogenase
VITGSAIGDNTFLATASGEVRAYDARSGELRWTWDPIPQDSTDPGFATWSDPRGGRVAAANAWSVLVADPDRDLVFVPTSSASPDYYGVERLGANVYANSVVALRASTGRVVWHFQTVHHDLWDYDNASPPALVTLQRGGREIPAVLQATKTGMLFVLHRETGEPLFPVEERPVPRSTVPGEQAWPTQPFSAIQLSPFAVNVDSAWGPSPEDRAACRSAMSGLRNEGIFTPPSEQGTLVIPSNIGGAHWGGVAVDERRQVAVIPVNRIAAMVQLLPRGPYDSGAARSEGFEYNPMRGTPYWMRRRFLLGPSGLPCTPPPFGSLVAVDLRTGGILWNVPLGEMSRDLPAALRAQYPGGLGSVHLGGPVVTAGGIVFIGATLDRALRAFDIETGRELWRADLPAGARATPMTYVAGGRQFVVIAAGGGGLFGEGDAVLAFALPSGN